MARSTSNSNSRGSAKNRRARKLWLLNEFGNGKRAACAINGPKCVGPVDFSSMTVDRWPIAGIDGGTYRRGNIRPACGPCNFSDGGKIGVRQRARLEKANA